MDSDKILGQKYGLPSKKCGKSVSYVNLTSFLVAIAYAALVSINPSYTITCFLLHFLLVEHNINVLLRAYV